MQWLLIIRLFTVLYFSVTEIVEIGRFALLAAILHECPNYLGDGGGGGLGGSKK